MKTLVMTMMIILAMKMKMTAISAMTMMVINPLECAIPPPLLVGPPARLLVLLIMQFRLNVVVAGLTRMEQVLDQEVAELLMDKIEMEVVIVIVLVVMVIVITDFILIIFIVRKL